MLNCRVTGETMIRKIFFWMHLSAGVAAGVFIFIMSASGVLLAFERQITAFVERDVRSVVVPNEAQPRSMNDLLDAVRRAGVGEPTAIAVRNEPQASAQFSIGRGRTVYVDPYTGAILGPSSARAREFFSTVERFHRALGAALGPKNAGRRLVGIANLVFGVLILLGTFLWIPRQWSAKALRAGIAFRSGLRAKAREWNWHNVVGIWCALPLLVIVLSGVVMSFDWANALLFRLSGSPLPNAAGRDEGGRRAHGKKSETGLAPNYNQLFATAKGINPDWRTITINVVRDANAPLTANIDAGNGGQPQKRAQFVLNRDTGAIVRSNTFESGSLSQRLRAFVRFGHTGEYYGLVGKAVAAIASLGECLLVYTGLALSMRRLSAALKRRKIVTTREIFTEQPVR